MSKGVKLSLDAAKRTKEAVIAFERTKRDLSGGDLHSSQHNLGFWAKITVAGTYDSAGVSDYKYSFVQVDHNEAGQWVAKTDWRTGDRTASSGYAVEAIYRSAYVPIGAIVWMYPAITQEYYLFDFRDISRHAITTSEITAMSGSTLGKGTVRFEKQTVDNLELDSDSPREMQVYNKSGETIDDDKRLTVFMVNGRWQVIYEDCT